MVETFGRTGVRIGFYSKEARDFHSAPLGTIITAEDTGNCYMFMQFSDAEPDFAPGQVLYWDGDANYRVTNKAGAIPYAAGVVTESPYDYTPVTGDYGWIQTKGIAESIASAAHGAGTALKPATGGKLAAGANTDINICGFSLEPMATDARKKWRLAIMGA